MKVTKMKRRIASALALVYALGINMLPTEYTGRINVYAAEEKQSYTQDFNGEMPAFTVGGSAGTDGGYLGSYTIEENVPGDNYLKVDGTSLGNNNNYVVQVPIDVTMDLNDEKYAEIVWEFDLMLGKTEANKPFGTSFRPYFHLADGDSLMTGFRFNNGTPCFPNQDTGIGYPVAVGGGWIADAWHTVKIVYHPESTTYDIYLDGAIKKTGFTYIGDEFVPDSMYIKVGIEGTKDISPYVGIDNLKVYGHEALSVVSSVPENGAENISCTTDIAMTLNNQVDFASITDAVIKVDGSVAGSAVVTAGGDDKSFGIDLGTTLLKNTEYTVTVSGIKDIYGQELAAEISFTTKGNYLDISSLGYYKDYVDESNKGTDITGTGLENGEITAEVSFVNACGDVSADETYPVSVIMGLFDKADDSLENIAYGGMSVGASATESNPMAVTATFDVANKDNYYIKTFIWDDFIGMESYTDSDKFSGTEPAPAAEHSSNGIDVSVNHEEKIVAVSGTLNNEEKGETTLLVLRPGKTAADITTSTVNTVVEYIGQGSTEADGGYSFNFGLNRTGLESRENQDYKVIFGGANISTKKETTFKYFGETTIGVVLSAIEGADGDKIGKYLTGEELVNGTININEVLKLDLTDYSALVYKSHVNEALAGKVFNNTTEVKNAFTNAVAVQKAIAEVQAGPIENMTAILTANNALLGLDLDNEYGYKSLVDKKLAQKSDAIDIVHNAIMQEDDLAELKEVFHKNVVIQAVNAATRDDMKQILENNNADLGLDFTGDFAKLDSDDQILVIQKLVEDYTFTEYGGNNRNVGIKPAFDYEVSVLLSETPTGGGGGGGGGRTNGGNAGNAVSTIKITSDNKTQQASEQKVDFVDIADVPWAQEGIRALQAMGCIEGVGDNRFAPNDVLTREQFVKILVLAFELYDETAEVQFNDVFANAWYYRYVASAYKHGIVTGNDDGGFGVGRTVTRQEMAAMLHRAAMLKKMSIPTVSEPLSFTDEVDIDAYAIDSIKALQSAGIISGVGESRFAPREATTRAMAAKVVYGILKLKY